MCTYSNELANPAKGEKGQRLRVVMMHTIHGGMTTVFAMNTDTKCPTGVCLRTGYGLRLHLPPKVVRKMNIQLGDESGASVFARYIEEDHNDDKSLRGDILEIEITNGVTRKFSFDKRFLKTKAVVELMPGEERPTPKATKLPARQRALIAGAGALTAIVVGFAAFAG